ncbi:MAG: DUF255 domain-containing protein [Nitrospirae bacterium]|nr:DUF255 domain-containing protein [Nitrospirota bacterium]
MNRLSEEKSACLKHSANQKIDWYPWMDESLSGCMNKRIIVRRGKERRYGKILYKRSA